MFPLGFIRIIIKCIYPKKKKNYDEVYDEIVVELMDATQKDLFFHGPTIMVQVLHALMEQVKMDHLSGGKCISKRPQRRQHTRKKKKKKERERDKQHLYNKSIDKIKPQIETKTNRTILKECTYIVSEEIFNWIMKIIGNATVSLLYICLMANL